MMRPVQTLARNRGRSKPETGRAAQKASVQLFDLLEKPLFGLFLVGVPKG